jgi:hypothetical protein
VISMGTIAVVVFGSLRFVPFTEQYARESVPKEVQQTASFKHTNRHLTTVWGFVFLVVAVDSLIQQLTDSSSARLDWVIPVAAIVGGFKYTAYYVAKVRAGGRAAGAETASP